MTRLPYYVHTGCQHGNFCQHAILFRMKHPETHTEVPAATRTGRSSAGIGLFATAPIKKGALIIEYTGERITVDEADQRGGQYLFQVTDTLTIDGRGRENKARYINHSAEEMPKPNTSKTATAFSSAQNAPLKKAKKSPTTTAKNSSKPTSNQKAAAA